MFSVIMDSYDRRTLPTLFRRGVQRTGKVFADLRILPYGKHSNATAYHRKQIAISFITARLSLLTSETLSRNTKEVDTISKN